MVLAGDVGGTKTVLQLLSPQLGLDSPLAEATYASADYPSLEAILSLFLAQVNQPVERACLGVAGPVVHGRASITNLPWVIDEREIQKTFGIPQVRLINDLFAIANAVPHLGSTDLHTLNTGQPVPGGALAVVAPGTGLGEAFLVWDGSRYQAYASEGGHADFAPTNRLERELLSYLQETLGFEHVSYERVCSGVGIPNIYSFLKHINYADEPDWLAGQLATATDVVPVILAAALDRERKSELCAGTLRLFVSILGAEAGNMALKVLATGGVYLGGGIPPRILPALNEGTFLQAFCNKGRFKELLSQIPVHVIMNQKTPLLGVAYYALEL
ncbi:MAG: glucokinase [Anaerolineae bacterium]|nr:glucokinase [Anaerolineae bacterium]